MFFLLPSGWSLVTRVLLAWDGGVTSFLVLLWIWMGGLTAQQMCSRYIEEDPSAPVILIVVTFAALLSLIAIVEPLATLRHVGGSERTWHFVLAAVTLADSWLLVPAMFTTHYADMYYSCQKSDRPLSFPDTDMPIFWDFAYFSFTIAAACQTADVFTRRSSIRRVVLIHEVISFVFNASILGFAINVTAGLIGG
ncbi:MAG: DUF1345 domain-containing protein [Steroidobacteraceae bacterium]